MGSFAPPGNSDLLLSEAVELTTFSLDLDACLTNLFSREISSHDICRVIFRHISAHFSFQRYN